MTATAPATTCAAVSTHRPPTTNPDPYRFAAGRPRGLRGPRRSAFASARSRRPLSAGALSPWSRQRRGPRAAARRRGRAGHPAPASRSERSPVLRADPPSCAPSSENRRPALASSERVATTRSSTVTDSTGNCSSAPAAFACAAASCSLSASIASSSPIPGASAEGSGADPRVGHRPLLSSGSHVRQASRSPAAPRKPGFTICRAALPPAHESPGVPGLRGIGETGLEPATARPRAGRSSYVASDSRTCLRR